MLPSYVRRKNRNASTRRVNGAQNGVKGEKLTE